MPSLRSATKPLSTLQTSKGTPTDALRLGLVLLLTCEALPAAADLERLAQALQQRGADLAAFNYVRRMRSLNLTGKAVAQPGLEGLGAGSSSQSQLLTWADKAFGQGLNAVTKGGWLQVRFRTTWVPARGWSVFACASFHGSSGQKRVPNTLQV